MVKRALKTVGVGGQAQAGKDTLSDYLALKLKKEVQGPDGLCLEPWGRNSFASEVKRIFCDTFFFSPEDIDKWKVLKESPPGFDRSVRESLTVIGDGFRSIMNDVWIKRAFRDETCLYKVLSDVRYLNEARKIREVGGPMILVCHPGRVNYTHNSSESELRPYIEWCWGKGIDGPIEECPAFQEGIRSQSDHIMTFSHDRDGPSEGLYRNIPSRVFFRNLSLFDAFIINDGSKEDLYNKIDSFLVPYIKANFEHPEDR